MTTRFMLRFTRDESGATAIEYGLIAALVFIAALSAMTLMGNTASAMFNEAMTAIKNAAAGG